MENVYQSLTITRQAHHKAMHKPLLQSPGNSRLIRQAVAIRKDHRRMGCRKIANRIKTVSYGRDKTEQLLMHSGFRIARKLKHVKTTQRQMEMYFPNLIQGMILNGKNQLIQTDITYYIIGENHYYIVFIIDVYTRLITGFNVSDTLKASENIKALEMALQHRAGDDLSKMIHHSDKGAQYIAKDYLALISNNNIQVSMCDYAWENAYSERINRTIKEEYLDPGEIKNLQQLKKEVKRSVYLYNHERGHKNLYRQMSPAKFEQHLLTINVEQYPQMKLHLPLEKVMNKNVSY
jgi:transposase InsO family protein